MQFWNNGAIDLAKPRRVPTRYFEVTSLCASPVRTSLACSRVEALLNATSEAAAGKLRACDFVTIPLIRGRIQCELTYELSVDAAETPESALKATLAKPVSIGARHHASQDVVQRARAIDIRCSSPVSARGNVDGDEVLCVDKVRSSMRTRAILRQRGPTAEAIFDA